MRGQILGVDVRTGEGQLAGDDGRRYRFRPDDWAHRGEPAIGLQVDFEPDQDQARAIFPLPAVAPAATGATLPAVGPAAAPPAVGPASPVRPSRDKIVAALLAFFLGPLGIHRFYLRRTGSGIVMLLLSLTVIGLAISYPWSLIDMIRYLVMDEDEFARRYD